jgi:DNA repair exonuclease SbcCD nuclease subunit
MNNSPDWSKVAVFGDIHFGLKSNSILHNQNCKDFLEWMITKAKAENVKTCIFLGDWHHIRNAINISTLNYSVTGLRMLNEAFDNVYFILGNHDIFFRDKLSLHSLPYANEFANITLIDSITIIKDFAFVPWLVGENWRKVTEIKQPYLFGHFELPKFKMNASIEMPDHGQLNREHFINQKIVFSGHFHKRQNQGKIWYSGNPFPHNYSDAWDDERGFMIWSPTDIKPIFYSWPTAPKYRTLTLSQLLLSPQTYIDNRTYARITIDLNLSYEDISWLKEQFESKLNALDISIIQTVSDNLTTDSDIAINFESVDTIVLSTLQSIESNTINKQRLIEIYHSV